MKFDDLMISHNLSFVKKNKSSAIEKHQFLISTMVTTFHELLTVSNLTDLMDPLQHQGKLEVMHD